jgi:uncharacterized protein
MLKRKAEKYINEWIRNPRRACLISGARQVGKTFSIRKCLNENGCRYLEINLILNPEYIRAFELSMTIDDLKFNLSALTDFSFVDNETYLFVDEVQKYPDIMTKIKFWVDDGRIKFIMSGSLLGIELKNLRSAPVGYLDEYDMYPLDYEEFIRASGVTEEVIGLLRDCYERRVAVPEVVNTRMMNHLTRYLVIGGMPAAVEAYVERGNVGEVTLIQENIIRQYKVDFTQYETEDKKLMLNAIYDQIPSQLLKQNKRFNYCDIQQKLRFEKLESSFLWLKFAGVAIAATNVTEPRIALRQNEKSSLLKLYSSDVGLLTSQYGNIFRSKLLFGEEKLNLGGVYENFVAQELNGHGYPVYFYCSHNIGELDFVIEHGGSVVPIEVKSGKDYRTHSAISKTVSTEEYGVEEAYVFAPGNVEKDGKIIYFPAYMATFVRDEVEFPTLSLPL